jgi:tetratricopeptide (TPR) repeat protein
VKTLFKKCLLTVVIFFYYTSLIAQSEKFPSTREDKQIFEEAGFWFNEHRYEKALELYKKLEPNNANASLLLFQMGVCYLNITGENENAYNYLKRANTGELNNTAFHFFYGMALHDQMKFDEAIEQYTLFLKVKKADAKQKKQAGIYVMQCQNAKELIKNPVPVIISNLGVPVNTNENEYVPLISSDETVLLYTYKGEKSNGGLQSVDPQNPDYKEYLEDIFMTLKDTNGNWIKPLQLEANINSNGNDACIALSSDAQFMYMFRSIDNDPGSIYVSELDGILWSDPELVEGEINSPEWDGSISISPDGKTAYFASERKGGNGQRDLYKAKKNKDGTWGKITNLGNKINTECNEDAPFLHPSGMYLLFSSDRPESMGGYDIFVCELQSDSSWGQPKNIGYPINSAGNEKFYTVSADGRHGYYASSKPGGLGKLDVYIVTPGLADRPILLAQLKGRITVNSKPVMARVDVQDVKSGIVLYSVTSNSATGKYLVDLPAGVEYKITYDAGGFPQQHLAVNTIGLSAFKEIIHDVHFKTDDAGQQPVDTTSTVTNINVETEPDLKTVPKSKLMELAHPDLVYRVQIGAYRYPQNFRYNNVMSLGKTDEKEKLDDDITRFTLGRFETLAAAYEFRDRVKQKGIGDTFVTAIFKGKRYLLVDLGPVLYEALKYELAYHYFVTPDENNMTGQK